MRTAAGAEEQETGEREEEDKSADANDKWAFRMTCGVLTILCLTVLKT